MDNILIIHIKIYRSNFFFVVSDGLGQVVFLKHSGNFGLKNIQKRTLDALNTILLVTIKFVLGLKRQAIYFKLECLNKEALQVIYKQLFFFFKKTSLNIIGFKVATRLVHNGCRKKK